MPFPFVPVVAGVGFVWGLWKLFAGSSSVKPDHAEDHVDPVGPVGPVGPIDTGTTYSDGYRAGEADGLAANVTTAFDTSPDYPSLMVHFSSSKPADWQVGYKYAFAKATKPKGMKDDKDVTGTVKPPAGSTYAEGAEVGEVDGDVARAAASFDDSPDYEHMMVHYDGTKSEAWKKGYLDAYNKAVA
jgi:hypothetical protein